MLVLKNARISYSISSRIYPLPSGEGVEPAPDPVATRLDSIRGVGRRRETGGEVDPCDQIGTADNQSTIGQTYNFGLLRLRRTCIYWCRSARIRRRRLTVISLLSSHERDVQNRQQRMLLFQSIW